MTTGISHHLTVEAKTYSVKKIEKELVITGKGDSPLWKNANELTDFIYPWEKEKPPFTLFRALHSKDWLYLLYNVKDEMVNIYVKDNDKRDVAYSDRVEIFFKQDDLLEKPYYGLELDPAGRVLDYRAKYHRQFNDPWFWPVGQLVVKTSRTKDGYIVEVAISKTSLEQLGLLKDNSLKAGIFRGECIKLTGDESSLKWISWVKPDSITPDFHIPSPFGVLLLEN